MSEQLLAIAAMGIFLAGSASEDEKQTEMNKLQGAWKSEVSVVDGTKRWTSVTIDGTAWISENNVEQGGMGQTGVVKFTYKLNTSKKPRQIDLTWAEFANKGKVELAVYKLEGDKLTLCFSQMGKERPKGFEVKEGSGQSLLLLERVKP